MTGSLGFPELLLTLIVILAAAAVVVPACRICARVGLPSWLGLLAVVPVVNVCLLYFFAFTKWPIETDLARPRQGSPSVRLH
jgi:hypothetical protein